MKSFCIIGMGRFGQSLATCLTRQRHQVLILDDDPEDIEALADYVTDAAYGEITSEKFLRNCEFTIAFLKTLCYNTYVKNILQEE